MAMRPLLLLAALGPLAGCGDWPDLGVGGEVAGYPELVPFDQVAAPGLGADAAAEAAAETDAALIARAEALQDRAAGIAPTDEDRDAFDRLRGSDTAVP
jgi:hypothetical protein